MKIGSMASLSELEQVEAVLAADLSKAREEYVKALRRFNRFVLDQEVPEDLCAQGNPEVEKAPAAAKIRRAAAA